MSSASPKVLSLTARTSSIQTFDSLDFARYSDDGERQVDERVAGSHITPMFPNTKPNFRDKQKKLQNIKKI